MKTQANYWGPKTCVTSPSGKVKPVKNLGWLVKHGQSVVSIRLEPRDDGARCGCILHALLHDGTKYRTAFACEEICRDWIKRPSLCHATVTDNLP